MHIYIYIYVYIERALLRWPASPALPPTAGTTKRRLSACLFAYSFACSVVSSILCLSAIYAIHVYVYLCASVVLCLCPACG